MTKITVLGGSGKMGQAIAEAVRTFNGIEIAASVGRRDDAKRAIAACDVVVDFSHPEFSIDGMRLALSLAKPCVIGTTGFTKPQESEIIDFAKSIAIVKAANFSRGVTVMAHLCGLLTSLLGESYDAEIIEMHHRGKKDAPSGTALLLAGEIASARHQELTKVSVFGRAGISGPRSDSEIGIHAVRGGDVAGEHTVCFAGVGERIEVVHRASGRSCFAAGALTAAQWIRHKPPGLYEMRDVLKIS
jgi:4-hydroxy-tetrahydrodipicolinate reductase